MSQVKRKGFTKNPLTTYGPPTSIEQGSGARGTLMLNNILHPEVCVCVRCFFFTLRSHSLCCLPEPV